MSDELARLIGRLLCFVGWHDWRSRTEREGDVRWTFNWCERHCPRYPVEFFVDLEHLEHLAVCTCRRHAISPTCPQHGFLREVA